MSGDRAEVSPDTGKGCVPVCVCGCICSARVCISMWASFVGCVYVEDDHLNWWGEMRGCLSCTRECLKERIQTHEESDVLMDGPVGVGIKAVDRGLFTLNVGYPFL